MSFENIGKTNLQSLKIVAIFAVLVGALVISTIIPVVMAQNSNSGSIPSVYPVNSKPYGMSYGDWTAKWWQWAVSIPKDINPGADMTGKNCALKQSGPVWFLAGTFGGPATRTCTIQAGNAILLPLLNSQCNYLAKPNLKTESQLLACAKSLNEGVSGLDATIDGTKIQGLQNYRVHSPLFNITYQANNIDGAPIGKTQAVSDGYWVMLKPLPVGDHTIHMLGSVVNYVQGTLNNFATEVTYHIKVH
jgi:hypothetical protein